MACAWLITVTWVGPAAAGRLIVDSAGRRVEIPDRIERIFAAGPPASVLITILPPEKLIGWNRKPPPDELSYLPAAVRNLPEIGRLTGRGGTANLEVVMAAKPDLIDIHSDLAWSQIDAVRRGRVFLSPRLPYISSYHL